LAEDFFFTKKLGKDPNNWIFFSEKVNSQKKPNRTRLGFTWEKHGLKVKDAGIAKKFTRGGKPTGAEETLQVLSFWKRGYERLRSGQQYAGARFFFVIYFGLIGSGHMVRDSSHKKRPNQLGFGHKLGALAAGAALSAIAERVAALGATYSTTET